MGEKDALRTSAKEVLVKKGSNPEKMNMISSYRGPPHWLSSKESAYKAGEAGLIPGAGRSPEEEMATYSSILAWEIP